jgi:carbonic anhydrase
MDSSAWDRLVTAHEHARPDTTGALLAHVPSAAVLACSDARVPPSVIFDQPAGSLFVVRIAGNTATPAALASLDYAVAQLGVELVVVLGHSECGAVHAASTGTCGGHLAPIVAPICEISRANPTASAARLVALNVAQAVRDLVAHDGPTGVAARSGSLQVRGAVHDLRTATLVDMTSSPIQPRVPVETP